MPGKEEETPGLESGTKSPDSSAEPTVPDVENAVEEHVDPEDLGDVDIGLDGTYVLTLVASQRFQLARNYQANALALQHLRLSVTANKAVGNERSTRDYEKRIEDLEPEVKHILRSIKAIDKEYPKAKAEMQKQVEKANREQK